MAPPRTHRRGAAPRWRRPSSHWQKGRPAGCSCSALGNRGLEAWGLDAVRHPAAYPSPGDPPAPQGSASFSLMLKLGAGTPGGMKGPRPFALFIFTCKLCLHRCIFKISNAPWRLPQSPSGRGPCNAFVCGTQAFLWVRKKVCAKRVPGKPCSRIFLTRVMWAYILSGSHMRAEPPA